MEHYAMITEGDLQDVAKMSLINGAEKSVHNTVQTTAAKRRKESYGPQEGPVVSPYNCKSKREFAAQCENVQKGQKYPQGESNPCLQDENLIS